MSEVASDSAGRTRVRGLRGATRVARDDSDDVLAATREMLAELLMRNGIESSSVISAIFTVTPDLVSEFPARAARQLGWSDVGMLCATEIAVPGSIARVIRVLLHVELPANRAARHVYMNGAEELRPDL
ncbi:MAG: chorismate mutase [Gemmatimonadota bacterium]|nr:chorismate mutase [Gemmatimonadota bacterium]